MSGWTEERVETLVKLWGEGYSAAQIAGKFRMTRNSVIGKVHRMGLCGREEATRRKRAGGLMGKPAVGKLILTPGAPPRPALPVLVPDPLPIPPSHPLPGPRIELAAITSRNCCWPVERDAETGDWMFCGHARHPKSGAHDRGYCETHWRISRPRCAA
jgi:GcrA cell cycle regulator